MTGLSLLSPANEPIYRVADYDEGHRVHTAGKVADDHTDQEGQGSDK